MATHLDFQIGRRRRPDLIKIGDRVSTLGWLPRPQEQHNARQLLLRAPSAFDAGRVPLYICPACADLGCGAVTVRVAREEGRVRWSDFRHQGVGEQGSPVEPFHHGRDFVFEWEAYVSILAAYG